MILENYLKTLTEAESACNGKALKNLIIAKCKKPQGIVLAYPIGDVSPMLQGVTKYGKFHLATTLILRKESENKYSIYNWDIPGIPIWLYHKQYSVTQPYHCNYLDFEYERIFLKQPIIKLIEKASCIRTQTKNGIILSKINSKFIQSDTLTINRKTHRGEIDTMIGKLSDELNNELVGE